MGADLLFSDDVCVGNLKETTNVRLIPNTQDLDTYTPQFFKFIYSTLYGI